MLEAVYVHSNSDNALNLNHKKWSSLMGPFFLSLSLSVCGCECVCVWGPRLEPLITHTYRCPHCQNRTASIPLLFGSKLEQWKWVNSSELHLVSFPSHVCELFGCMGEKKKEREKMCHCQLPSLSNTVFFLLIIYFRGGGDWTFFYFLLRLCVLFTSEICIEKRFSQTGNTARTVPSW